MTLLYLVFFVIFFLTRFAYQPAWYDMSLQLSMVVVGFFFVMIGLKAKVSTYTWWAIMFYHLLFAICMRMVNIEFYNDPFGSLPIDADFYDTLGQRFANDPFENLLNYLTLNGYKMDDFGYPFIVWSGYRIAGSYCNDLLLVVNAIIMSLGAYYLYKLSLNFVDKKFSKLIALIWGVMPYAIYTTACGLKENFFGFCVIMAFYAFFKYVKKKNVFNLCFCLLALGSLFFFRLAIGYFAILSMLSYFLLGMKFVKRHIKLFIFLALVVIVPLFPMITSSVLQQRGYEYDSIVNVKNSKISESGGAVAQYANFAAGFIGPFPNFVSPDKIKRTYITIYSFTPFIKLLISFFFLYALYPVIKRKEIKMAPFVIFILFNIIMMMFTFFTLHDRYHWPEIPLFMIVAAYGYIEYNKVKRKSIYRKLYRYYFLFVCLLIMFFNFR